MDEIGCDLAKVLPQFVPGNVNPNTLDGIRLGFKTLRIYISAHFVSTSFKFNVC